MSDKSILIIEDEPDIVDILTEILRDAFPGSTITVAVDGAGSLLQLDRGPYDLIVSDVRLPGVTGEELLSAICAVCKGGGSAVIFSGQENIEETRCEHCANHRIRFVAKPCPYRELSRILTDAASA